MHILLVLFLERFLTHTEWPPLSQAGQQPSQGWGQGLFYILCSAPRSFSLSMVSLQALQCLAQRKAGSLCFKLLIISLPQPGAISSSSSVGFVERKHLSLRNVRNRIMVLARLEAWKGLPGWIEPRRAAPMQENRDYDPGVSYSSSPWSINELNKIFDRWSFHICMRIMIFTFNCLKILSFNRVQTLSTLPQMRWHHNKSINRY